MRIFVLAPAVEAPLQLRRVEFDAHRRLFVRITDTGRERAARLDRGALGDVVTDETRLPHHEIVLQGADRPFDMTLIRGVNLGDRGCSILSDFRTPRVAFATKSLPLSVLIVAGTPHAKRARRTSAITAAARGVRVTSTMILRDHKSVRT